MNVMRSDHAEILHLRHLLEEANRNEKDARRGVSLLNTIINLLPVGVTVQAKDGEFLIVNETAAAQFNVLADTSVGASLPIIPFTEEAIRKRDQGVGLISSGRSTTTHDRIIGPNGQRTLLTSHKPVRILEQPLLISTSVDFTDQKKIEDELSRRAYFDELTGLPNRSRVQEHIECLLAGEEPKGKFALAFLDIDNFKHINDYYTHAIGDALLVKVAERIANHIREFDVLSRISGDEFLLVLSPLDQADTLSKIIDNLLAQLKQPFFIEGFEIFTSASIGVSIYPEHGQTYEVLRRSADAAMYRAKGEAKGGAALFDSELARNVTFRMAQEQRLRLAVRDNRFCCAFQPKVDMRTQEVVGLEALIRWRDENDIIQAPGEFIGLAVELGLIQDLTYLVLAEIMKSMDLIDEAFGAHTTISINVAAKQAGDPKFMRSFCDELKATNCAGRFMIEITEDAFVSRDDFQTEVLPMLRELGIRVSIDDFGIGYSSLSALADITADEIKIDRSFITDIHLRPRSQSVLKAIEALSDALGMTIIAEGVETFEELAYLQAATRIRYGQGFYFAKPVLIEDLAPARRSIEDSRPSSISRERIEPRGPRARAR